MNATLKKHLLLSHIEKFASGSANIPKTSEILDFSSWLSSVKTGYLKRSLTSEWLTTDEAAEYLGISTASLRNMTSNGLVPYYKLPGTRSNRYLVNELRELLLSQRRGGSL